MGRGPMCDVTICQAGPPRLPDTDHAWWQCHSNALPHQGWLTPGLPREWCLAPTGALSTLGPKSTSAVGPLS